MQVSMGSGGIPHHIPRNQASSIFFVLTIPGLKCLEHQARDQGKAVEPHEKIPIGQGWKWNT